MRCILVDWLVEVHYKFRLNAQTLWLTVNTMDRYLNCALVERTKLQLVGVASLLLACKYEESGPPEVKDCIFITDYAYDRAEILLMERSILTSLKYELCVPTGYHFLVKYVQVAGGDDKLKYLAFYYAERNLQEYETLELKPHVFVAACLYAALCQQRQLGLTSLFMMESEAVSILSTDKNDSKVTDQLPSLWTPALVKETGLTEAELLPIAKNVINHVGEEPITASKRLLIAARKKYNMEKYYYVSNLLLPMFT